MRSGGVRADLVGHEADGEALCFDRPAAHRRNLFGQISGSRHIQVPSLFLRLRLQAVKDTAGKKAVPPALRIKQVSRAQLASTLQQHYIAGARVIRMRRALGIRHSAKGKADHIIGGLRDRELHVHVDARFNLACHCFHALLGHAVPSLRLLGYRVLYTRKAVTDTASARVRIIARRDRLWLRTYFRLVDRHRLDAKWPSGTNGLLQLVHSAGVAGFDFVDIKFGNVAVVSDPPTLALDHAPLAS